MENDPTAVLETANRPDRTSEPPMAPDARETPPEARAAVRPPPLPSGAPAVEVPKAPEVPSSVSNAPASLGVDTWTTRFRVWRDGAVYGIALVILYKLRIAEKLDIGTGVAVMLVAGVRPAMIAELLAAKVNSTAVRTGAPAVLAGVSLDSWLRVLRGH